MWSKWQWDLHMPGLALSVLWAAVQLVMLPANLAGAIAPTLLTFIPGLRPEHVGVALPAACLARSCSALLDWTLCWAGGG